MHFLSYFWMPVRQTQSSSIFPDGNTFQNNLQYSTGISLQTLFYNDRVIRFEYSLNALKESGFYVHFKKAI